MPNIKEQDKIPRKLLPIIYVLDTSGSMQGDRIAAVNQGMLDTMEVLKDIAKGNDNAEIKIGILQFSTGAKWITEDGLIFIEDFYWNDLTAGGLTDYGSALNELYDKMSRDAFFQSDVGYKVPNIIFMSDGEPTDDYHSALERLKSNTWYNLANKIAIAIGDEADIGALLELSSGKEAVIKVTDIEILKNLIKTASVTIGQLGGESRPHGKNMNKDIINNIPKQLGDGLQVISAYDSQQDISAEPKTDDGQDPFPGWKD